MTSLKKKGHQLGMSTHLSLYKTLPAEPSALMALKEHCDKLNVSYPAEVATFLKGSRAAHPHFSTLVEAETYYHRCAPTPDVVSFSEDGQDGFDIDVEELAKAGIKRARFFNSY